MLLFWNVRGLNDKNKKYQLKRVLQKFTGSIICLLETHNKETNRPLSFSSFCQGRDAWIIIPLLHWGGSGYYIILRLMSLFIEAP